jgi:uncharacterized protein (DUF1501 family)
MKLTRRNFLKLSGMSALAGVLYRPSWMPRMAFRPATGGPAGDILICIFLRGAMDGLNAVIPHAETPYHDLRSTIRIPDPDQPNGAIDLDGFFGLHPALEPLKEIYTEGDLAFVHASGSPDPSRSHFDAQDFMERGVPGNKTITTGWLARHLASVTTQNASPFRAVGMGNILQTSLHGPVSALALKSIAAFHLNGNEQEIARVQQTLQSLYMGDAWLDHEGQQVFEAFDFLAEADPMQYQPQHGAAYDEGLFGKALMQIAQIIRADMGLEVTCIDLGGWDTHAEQGDVDGYMAQLLEELAAGLEAFYTDMQDDMYRITLVTMSEFGRRVKENASRGTDHGHGNVMFIMGGGVNGGRVYGDWPGLEEENLDRGDLAITTDYRTVLSEIVQKRLLNPQLSQVFPDFQQTPFLGVVQDRSGLLHHHQFWPRVE